MFKIPNRLPDFWSLMISELEFICKLMLGLWDFTDDDPLQEALLTPDRP